MVSSGVKDRENQSVVAMEHGEVVDRRPRVRRAPFRIRKAVVEALKSRCGAETFVGPSVGRTTVPQINESTLLHMNT